ncbi:hypothetical protein PV327_010158 [Microctonus hyperodae]|uniref:AIMP2 thioredoxin-like domain-containing protein n=1 Tax=Microctonus hyperodae TaxID=165561 RepID=A0AA39FRP8_MICHY|nr:hypothetical protein PV327_010158 [Microctonus hyperodae]
MTSLDESSALATRQKVILDELAELKHEVLNICGDLKKNHASKFEVSDQLPVFKVPELQTLVVNANPSQPCYSILALRKIWRNTDFIISSYFHSSTKSNKICEFENTHPSGKRNVVNLSLIWKNVTDVRFTVAGIHGSVILGESNFLRYLFQILSNDCYKKSLSVINIVKLNRILDLSHEMIHQKSSKIKNEILALLNDKLGSYEWFCGESVPGIADAAVWSAIKQMSMRKLPSNLNSHYERCENIFLN